MESGKMLPNEIESESFRIITQELGERRFPAGAEPIIKRVIHTTADFDYADSLYFSTNVIEKVHTAINCGATIITDTQMSRSGINKSAAASFGSETVCFIADEDVALAAKENATTRSVAAVNKAALLYPDGIFVVGNAPTALFRICELADAGKLNPQIVVGVPVGFVNVAQSKERLIESGISCIVARGRKGGSNVAAAIINALMYSLMKK